MTMKKYGLKRHKHRCFNCDQCYYDESLQYMPEYQCKANNHHHIFIGVPGESDRPKWCPLYGPEMDDEEMEEY